MSSDDSTVRVTRSQTFSTVGQVAREGTDTNENMSDDVQPSCIVSNRTLNMHDARGNMAMGDHNLPVENVFPRGVPGIEVRQEPLSKSSQREIEINTFSVTVSLFPSNGDNELVTIEIPETELYAVKAMFERVL
jgi:hypothetical protein